VTRSIGTSLILLANIKICWDKHSSLLCVAENDEEKKFLDVGSSWASPSRRAEPRRGSLSAQSAKTASLHKLDFR
jgi:hypothetical protein